MEIMDHNVTANKLVCFLANTEWPWSLNQLPGPSTAITWASIKCRDVLLHPHHEDIINWKHFLRYWPFVRGTTNHRWITLTKASDEELWCFRWSAPDQTLRIPIWRRWSEAPSYSWWCHCNNIGTRGRKYSELRWQFKQTAVEVGVWINHYILQDWTRKFKQVKNTFDNMTLGKIVNSFMCTQCPSLSLNDKKNLKQMDQETMSLFIYIIQFFLQNFQSWPSNC